jgi:adenylyl-sulfate kinase
MGWPTFLLDGDNVLYGLCGDLGFSAQDRSENIRRIGEVAKLFAESGFLVIVAFISPYRADRDRVRNIAGDLFHEIYVTTPLSICETRDPKGLYAKARRGEIESFTGISAPYESPVEPQLVIDTSELSVEQSMGKMLAYVIEKFDIGRIGFKIPTVCFVASILNHHREVFPVVEYFSRNGWRVILAIGWVDKTADAAAKLYVNFGSEVSRALDDFTYRGQDRDSEAATLVKPTQGRGSKPHPVKRLIGFLWHLRHQSWARQRIPPLDSNSTGNVSRNKTAFRCRSSKTASICRIISADFRVGTDAIRTQVVGLLGVANSIGAKI